MSTLVFDITQFFPLLNYQLLSKNLSKVGFDFQISNFFSSYLILNIFKTILYLHSLKPI